MRPLLVTAILIFGFTAAPVRAEAETLCGELRQQIVRPSCHSGQACERYFRIAHVLTSGTYRIELQTADYDVLAQLAKDASQRICVEGWQPPQRNFFEVTKVDEKPACADD